MITVYGAAGRTGAEVVRLAVSRGVRVRAVAREPGRIPVEDALLEKVRADVLDPDSVRGTLDDAEAAISTVGPGLHGAETTLYSEGTANILRAGSHGMRLLAVSSTVTLPAKQSEWPFRYVGFPILERAFGPVYRDMRRMEGVLRDSTSEWSILKPPRLTDGRARGAYRRSVDAPLPWALSISRQDLAAALLDAVTDRDTVRRIVVVSK